MAYEQLLLHKSHEMGGGGKEWLTSVSRIADNWTGTLTRSADPTENRPGGRRQIGIGFG